MSLLINYTYKKAEQEWRKAQRLQSYLGLRCELPHWLSVVCKVHCPRSNYNLTDGVRQQIGARVLASSRW